MYFLATLPADLHSHTDAGHQAEAPPCPLWNVSENLWHNSVKGTFHSSAQLCIGDKATRSHASFDTTRKISVHCDKVRTIRWPCPLLSGHAEIRDYCPMRCWWVTHFCVFLRGVLHMRLSLGLAHLSFPGYRQLDAGCLGVKLQTNRPVLTPYF